MINLIKRWILVRFRENITVDSNPYENPGHAALPAAPFPKLKNHLVQVMFRIGSVERMKRVHALLAAVCAK